MCGITGFLEPAHHMNAAELHARAVRLADAIQHRGPDDSGAWVDENTGLAMGFRRLEVHNLSPLDRQPMFSADERYIIVFDGEIYNRVKLREQLRTQGRFLRGRSDAGIILAGMVQWGLLPTLERLNGMFAFALWDCRERRLFLARDRMGVKPLYYGWSGGVFLFASELKAMRKHPAFHASVNPDALTLLLRYGYIPAPHTIYHGIHKLQPGTALEVAPDGSAGTPQVFWSARQTAVQGVLHPFNGSERDAVDQLDTLLRDSIGLRMAADVPLGAFLSGGIDSSTIVAQMQVQSSRPVKTFTLGFSEAGFNEAEHARAIARHLQTEHTELVVTSQDALGVIPLLPEIYDEPFADSSQIPTYLVSRLARQQVAVVLSGDGGDELFAGYNRYRGLSRLWKDVGWVPQPLRLLAKDTLDLLSASGLNQARLPLFLQKALRDRHILPAPTPQSLYHRFISLWQQPAAALRNGMEPPTNLTDPNQWPSELDFDHWMMYMDLSTSLPDDSLVKTDRAGMAVSLETRAPLLDDHRLIEFAWRIPLGMKIRNGHGKWLLRQALCRYVPPVLVERPKQGFMIPLADWLRGPLRPWAEAQFVPTRLAQEGFFKPAMIREKWQQFLEGKNAASMELWTVLMFQAWLAHNR
ncbi:MAG: asparagine synthase (glutamine-hydrolyzing) [Anaerolineaceae bacterium]|nr:asparagine synthase (glutamine-hydrolyzing) [Anaerolineaceae bacterium]